MSVKRIVASALLVLTTVGAEVTYGAPVQSAAALRAHWCCATRCDRALPAVRAARCCGIGVEDGAASIGTAAHNRTPDVAPAVREVPASFGAPVALAGCLAEPLDAVRVRGAPIYLLTRSLLI